LLQLLPYICLKKIYLYVSIGNGKPREPALCQLYRHTFVPYFSLFLPLVFLSIFSAANRSTRYAESRHFTTVERLIKFHFASLHINEVARRTGVVVLARFRLPVWGHSDVFAATAETMQSLSVQFICTIESSAGYLATFISLLGFDCHS